MSTQVFFKTKVEERIFWNSYLEIEKNKNTLYQLPKFIFKGLKIFFNVLRVKNFSSFSLLNLPLFFLIRKIFYILEFILSIIFKYFGLYDDSIFDNIKFWMFYIKKSANFSLGALLLAVTFEIILIKHCIKFLILHFTSFDGELPPLNYLQIIFLNLSFYLFFNILLILYFLVIKFDPFTLYKNDSKKVLKSWTVLIRTLIVSKFIQSLYTILFSIYFPKTLTTVFESNYTIMQTILFFITVALMDSFQIFVYTILPIPFKWINFIGGIVICDFLIKYYFTFKNLIPIYPDLQGVLIGIPISFTVNTICVSLISAFTFESHVINSFQIIYALQVDAAIKINMVDILCNGIKLPTEELTNACNWITSTIDSKKKPEENKKSFESLILSNEFLRSLPPSYSSMLTSFAQNNSEDTETSEQINNQINNSTKAICLLRDSLHRGVDYLLFLTKMEENRFTFRFTEDIKLKDYIEEQAKFFLRDTFTFIKVGNDEILKENENEGGSTNNSTQDISNNGFDTRFVNKYPKPQEEPKSSSTNIVSETNNNQLFNITEFDKLISDKVKIVLRTGLEKKSSMKYNPFNIKDDENRLDVNQTIITDRTCFSTLLHFSLLCALTFLAEKQLLFETQNSNNNPPLVQISEESSKKYRSFFTDSTFSEMFNNSGYMEHNTTLLTKPFLISQTMHDYTTPIKYSKLSGVTLYIDLFGSESKELHNIGSIFSKFHRTKVHPTSGAFIKVRISWQGTFSFNSLLTPHNLSQLQHFETLSMVCRRLVESYGGDWKMYVNYIEFTLKVKTEIKSINQTQSDFEFKKEFSSHSEENIAIISSKNYNVVYSDNLDDVVEFIPPTDDELLGESTIDKTMEIANSQILKSENINESLNISEIESFDEFNSFASTQSIVVNDVQLSLLSYLESEYHSNSNNKDHLYSLNQYSTDSDMDMRIKNITSIIKSQFIWSNNKSIIKNFYNNIGRFNFEELDISNDGSNTYPKISLSKALNAGCKVLVFISNPSSAKLFKNFVFSVFATKDKLELISTQEDENNNKSNQEISLSEHDKKDKDSIRKIMILSLMKKFNSNIEITHTITSAKVMKSDIVFVQSIESFNEIRSKGYKGNIILCSERFNYIDISNEIKIDNRNQYEVSLPASQNSIETLRASILWIYLLIPLCKEYINKNNENNQNDLDSKENPSNSLIDVSPETNLGLNQLELPQLKHIFGLQYSKTIQNLVQNLTEKVYNTIDYIFDKCSSFFYNIYYIISIILELILYIFTTIIIFFWRKFVILSLWIYNNFDLILVCGLPRIPKELQSSYLKWHILSPNWNLAHHTFTSDLISAFFVLNIMINFALGNFTIFSFRSSLLILLSIVIRKIFLFVIYERIKSAFLILLYICYLFDFSLMIAPFLTDIFYIRLFPSFKISYNWIGESYPFNTKITEVLGPIRSVSFTFLEFLNWNDRRYSGKELLFILINIIALIKYITEFLPFEVVYIVTLLEIIRAIYLFRLFFAPFVNPLGGKIIISFILIIIIILVFIQHYNQFILREIFLQLHSLTQSQYFTQTFYDRCRTDVKEKIFLISFSEAILSEFITKKVAKNELSISFHSFYHFDSMNRNRHIFNELIYQLEIGSNLFFQIDRTYFLRQFQPLLLKNYVHFISSNFQYITKKCCIKIFLQIHPMLSIVRTHQDILGSIICNLCKNASIRILNSINQDPKIAHQHEIVITINPSKSYKTKKFSDIKLMEVSIVDSGRVILNENDVNKFSNENHYFSNLSIEIESELISKRICKLLDLPAIYESGPISNHPRYGYYQKVGVPYLMSVDTSKVSFLVSKNNINQLDLVRRPRYNYFELYCENIKEYEDEREKNDEIQNFLDLENGIFFDNYTRNIYKENKYNSRNENILGHYKLTSDLRHPSLGVFLSEESPIDISESLFVLKNLKWTVNVEQHTIVPPLPSVFLKYDCLLIDFNLFFTIDISKTSASSHSHNVYRRTIRKQNDGQNQKKKKKIKASSLDSNTMDAKAFLHYIRACGFYGLVIIIFPDDFYHKNLSLSSLGYAQPLTATMCAPYSLPPDSVIQIYKNFYNVILKGILWNNPGTQ